MSSSVASTRPCKAQPENGEISPPGKRARLANFEYILSRSKSNDYSLERQDMGRQYCNGSRISINSDTRVPQDVNFAMDAKDRGNIFANEKIINDCIHGTIKLPPAILAIVDTPQFQRLRLIKQTGTCHLVYPNATHNRFQHSLGVGHIARKYAQELQKRHPKWVDDKDVLCVMMAGICHDLGHGPYSHLWEKFIMTDPRGHDFHHETLSLDMFDHLIESNDLKEKLKHLAGVDEMDLWFVKELIAGPISKDTNRPDSNLLSSRDWPYKGRPEYKSFLYEIVANKETGIDVDKWDYFLRDDYYLKIGLVFDYERFITYSQVMKVETSNLPSRKKIVIRDKEASNLEEMCRDRARLHLFGYQHRISKIADGMLKDAWVLAKDHVKVKGRNGEIRDLISASTERDMVAYEKLTDEYVHFKIMESDEPKLKPAQEILKRLDKRDFYKDVLEINSREYSCLAKKSEEDVLSMLSELALKFKPVDTQQIKVLKKVISTGTEFKSVFFYTKSNDIFESNINSRVSDLDQEIFYICSKDASQVDRISQLAKAWKESLKK